MWIWLRRLAIVVATIWAAVRAIPESNYDALYEGNLLDHIAFNYSFWGGRFEAMNGRPGRASFIVVIPYAKSFLSEIPSFNRSIQSWREYCELNKYSLKLVDMASVIRTHGQHLIKAAEKRNKSIFDVGKPLVLLRTFPVSRFPFPVSLQSLSTEALTFRCCVLFRCISQDSSRAGGD